MSGLQLILGEDSSIKHIPHLDSDLLQHDYNVLTSYSEKNLSFVLTGFESYPFTRFDYRESIILIEGMIYNRSDDKIKSDLKKIVDSLLCDEILNPGQSKIVHDYDGEFWIMIYAPKANRLVLFSDRWGRLPGFFYQSGKRFIFSRNIEFILNHVPSVTVNRQSIIQQLSIEFVLNNKTLFNEIERCPESTEISIHFSESFMTFGKRDYSPINISAKGKPERLTDSVEKAYSLFKTSTQSRLDKLSEYKHNFAVDLSGGFDTRAVFSMLSKLDRSFVACHENTGGQSELEIANMLAGKFGIRLETIFSDRPSLNISIIRNVNRFTDGQINSLTNVNGFYDNIARKTTLPGIDSNFRGFVGEFIRNVYGASPRIETFNLLILNDLYTNYLPVRLAARLLKCSSSELNDGLNNSLQLYSDSDQSASARKLFYEFCRTLVNTGEDRHRLFFWSVCPFWGNQFMQYAVNELDPSRVNYRFFVELLKRIDVRTLEIPFAGSNRALNSNLSKTLFYSNKRLRRAYRYSNFGLQSRSYFKSLRKPKGFKDEFVNALASEMMQIVKNSKLLNTLFDVQFLEKFCQTKADRLQFYQLLSIVLYLDDLEKDFGGKIEIE